MRTLFGILLLIFLMGCHSSKLPTKRLAQYELNKGYSYSDNELRIELGNPLLCPVRIWVFTKNQNLQSRFDEINPIVMNSKTDTILVFKDTDGSNSPIRIGSRLGSTSKEIKMIALDLPFKKGQIYRVIQGNNTNFTHKGSWSRYAIDFDLKIGDTVCAATDGFVVGVIDQYRYGGKGEEWRNFGNFITLYEPNSGLFTQYVHLKQNGSLVKIGDRVERGQPIGLSGNTGQSTMEHLHFNCLIPAKNNQGLVSVPYEFVGGHQSEQMRAGDIVLKY